MDCGPGPRDKDAWIAPTCYPQSKAGTILNLGTGHSELQDPIQNTRPLLHPIPPSPSQLARLSQTRWTRWFRNSGRSLGLCCSTPTLRKECGPGGSGPPRLTGAWKAEPLTFGCWWAPSEGVFSARLELPPAHPREVPHPTPSRNGQKMGCLSDSFSRAGDCLSPAAPESIHNHRRI